MNQFCNELFFFIQDEIEELPIDLQYLDEDKEVEPDADIRKLLLEALLQLCATKKGREILRGKNSVSFSISH